MVAASREYAVPLDRLSFTSSLDAPRSFATAQHAGTHRRGVPPPLGGPARAPRRPIEDYSVEFIAKKNRILIGKA